MKIQQAINSLEQFIKRPAKGLPEEVFLFMSRITPLVNVDLLIKNKQKQTLLTWRDDGYFPPGWHIPGGVVRYQETMLERIEAVAATELGTKVSSAKYPLLIREVIIPYLKYRSHAISFLFECSLIRPPARKLKYLKGDPQPGQWAWHSRCPKEMILAHRLMYRSFI